jgi:hypothetical protein
MPLMFYVKLFEQLHLAPGKKYQSLKQETIYLDFSYIIDLKLEDSNEFQTALNGTYFINRRL